MGVIIGKGFRDYVTNQINIRQQKLGLNDRDNDLLKYINNKTSWLRLTSGVDVDAFKTAELGLSGQEGNILAKNNVLFSARKYTNTNLENGKWEGQFTSGVGYSDLSSYGYNSTPDYGLVPPPGVLSADIKSLNKGSLREANIQITCHNLQQFKVIETLYLRLGYSILLEWGHTFWYDNNGELRSDMPDWVHQGFLKGDYSQENILDILTKQREEFKGNYDGFFGVVVNFDWSIRVDGGYDISIRVKSIGDIIESLKLNVNYPYISESGTNKPVTLRYGNGVELTSQEINERKQKGLLPAVIANSGRSTLDNLLYGMRQLMENELNVKPGKNYGYSSTFLSTYYISIATGLKVNYINENEANLSTSISGYRACFTGLSQNKDGETKSDVSYYITLGTLLRTIENFLSLSDITGDGKPIFSIDYKSDDNLCFTIPKQLSVDPNVCLIPIGDLKTTSANTPTNPLPYVKIIRTTIEDVFLGYQDSSIKTENISTLPVGVSENTPIVDTSYGLSTAFNPSLVTTTTVYYNISSTIDVIKEEDLTIWESFKNAFEDIKNAFTFSSESNPSLEESGGILDNIDFNVFRTTSPYIGKTMGILINIDYISNLLDSSIDEEGKLALYDFLKNIMSNIQTSLGSINNFEVIYNSETNIFSIIDNTFIPGVFDYLKLSKPVIAKFNPNLLKPNYGSFVTNVDIVSKLDNKFTSMITIGAQVNGNVVGENATAFSRWNVGLTDRIITVKQNINDPNASTNSATTSSLTPEEAYSNNILALFKYRTTLNQGTISIDDISNNRQSIIDVFKYEVGYFTDKNLIPGVGFIPLSLNLTFDGLSGIRIYDAYNIDDTLLPGNYKNNIQFVAVGVSHKIDSNGWKTSLESISGPKQNTPTTTNISQPINYIQKSTTNIKKAEQLLNNGGCDNLNSSRLSIVEKILKEANTRGIKDKNRLTCLLTVAYAEARFDLKKLENFNYRIDKIGTGTKDNWNGDATVIFKDSLRKAGVQVPNDVKNILSNPSDSLANYVYSNKGLNGGPSTGDGSRYRGRGISQTTFKDGYIRTQEVLKKYNINIDLITNPDNIFQYEIPVLIIGKLEGLYGKKLSNNIDYINNATNIAQTQNGGNKSASDNYNKALNCINNNSKIQELIQKYS